MKEVGFWFFWLVSDCAPWWCEIERVSNSVAGPQNWSSSQPLSHQAAMTKVISGNQVSQVRSNNEATCEQSNLCLFSLKQGRYLKHWIGFCPVSLSLSLPPSIPLSLSLSLSVPLIAIVLYEVSDWNLTLPLSYCGIVPQCWAASKCRLELWKNLREQSNTHNSWSHANILSNAITPWQTEVWRSQMQNECKFSCKLKQQWLSQETAASRHEQTERSGTEDLRWSLDWRWSCRWVWPGCRIKTKYHVYWNSINTCFSIYGAPTGY